MDDLGATNYDSVEKQLNEPEMTSKKNKKYLEKIIKDAVYKRNQLKAAKGNVTKQFNSGNISETEAQINYKRINNANAVSGQCIRYYQNKVKTIKGSGIRKKKKGGNVMIQNSFSKK